MNTARTEQSNPTRKLRALDVHSLFLVGYIVYEKIENEDRRNPAAPSRNVRLRIWPGFVENCRTARSKPASVAGKDELTIGLMNFSSSSSVPEPSTSARLPSRL